MAAVGQIQCQKLVAAVDQRQIGGRVGLRARMGLNVGEFAFEQTASTFDRDVFGLVHLLASAVVTLGRQALGVLVRQDAAHARHDRLGSEVFRGDQFQSFTLTMKLGFDNSENFRIVLFKDGPGFHGMTSWGWLRKSQRVLAA